MRVRVGKAGRIAIHVKSAVGSLDIYKPLGERFWARIACGENNPMTANEGRSFGGFIRSGQRPERRQVLALDRDDCSGQGSASLWTETPVTSPGHRAQASCDGSAWSCVF